MITVRITCFILLVLYNVALYSLVAIGNDFLELRYPFNSEAAKYETFTEWFNTLTSRQAQEFAEDLIQYGFHIGLRPGESIGHYPPVFPEGDIITWVWSDDIYLNQRIWICSVNPAKRCYRWLVRPEPDCDSVFPDEPPAFSELLELSFSLWSTKVGLNRGKDYAIRTRSTSSYLSYMDSCDLALSRRLPEDAAVYLQNSYSPFIDLSMQNVCYAFMASDKRGRIIGCSLFTSGFFEQAPVDIENFEHRP
jgi:hypothetical protein